MFGFKQQWRENSMRPEILHPDWSEIIKMWSTLLRAPNKTGPTGRESIAQG
jgi:hypothetical protein